MMRPSGEDIATFGLYGEITRTGINALIEAIRRRATGRAILMEIDSEGGHLDDALRLSDVLLKHSNLVIVEVSGLCASSATVVLAAGGFRRISRPGLVYVHRTRFPAETGDASAFRRAADQLEQWDYAVASRIAVASGRSYAEVRRWMDEGETFDADEALALGLVHEIEKI